MNGGGSNDYGRPERNERNNSGPAVRNYPPLPTTGASAPNPWDRPAQPYTTDDAGVARLQGTIQQQPIR